MTFYNYGVAINRPSALSCIFYAMDDAGETHVADWSKPIGEDNLTYTDLNVQLNLFPSAGMTWSMWSWAAVEMGIFLDQYDCFAFNFKVELLRRHDVFGWGSLEDSII